MIVVGVVVAFIILPSIYTFINLCPYVYRPLGWVLQGSPGKYGLNH